MKKTATVNIYLASLGCVRLVLKLIKGKYIIGLLNINLLPPAQKSTLDFESDLVHPMAVLSYSLADRSFIWICEP